MLHIVEGFPEVQLRTPTIELVLAGKANWDEIQSRNKPKRLPITLAKLDLIRCLLSTNKEMPAVERASTWSICTLTFWGCFRHTLH